MSVFKVIYEKYNQMEDLENLIKYAVREDKCIEGVYGAQGLLKGSSEEMFQQMYDIKYGYYKKTGRQAKHFVLSFSKEEERFIGINEALRIGYTVASYFDKWQVVFGVHTDTDNLHIHFILNTVSFVDGLKFNMSLTELRMIGKQIENLIQQFYNLKYRPLFTEIVSPEERMELMLNPRPARFPCEVWVGEIA